MGPTIGQLTVIPGGASLPPTPTASPRPSYETAEAPAGDGFQAEGPPRAPSAASASIQAFQGNPAVRYASGVESYQGIQNPKERGLVLAMRVVASLITLHESNESKSENPGANTPQRA